MTSGVQIKFDGKLYGYWQSVEIHESVDDLCSSINLSVASLEQGLGVLPITENSVIEVLVDGLVATTVRVDIDSREVDANNHTISLEGRGLGRELVDCQYSMTLKNLKLAEIINRLCTLFKVPLKVLFETVIVPDFSMQCESPSNALINAARAANLLLYPSANGGLILAEPNNDEPVATLIYGEHFKKIRIIKEHKLRFSEYVVKGYDHSANSSTKGAVKDDDFMFFRPMHIIADKYGQGVGGCDRRAQLERNRRKARAHRIEVDVYGWKHAGGLWMLNKQVRIIYPAENIDAVFLIGERAFTQDSNGGSITRLQVMSREAFIGEKVKAAKASASSHAKSHKGHKKTARKGRKPHTTAKTVINPGEI
jgi:prophage tail gpP-like protein